METRTVLIPMLFTVVSVGFAPALFFYSPSCPHCHRVLESGVLQNLDEVKMVDLSNASAEERTLFYRLVQYYNLVPGVPTLILYEEDPFNGTALQGDRDIIQYLRGGEEDSGGITRIERINPLVVLLTAAADSVNPCIMSILILFLSQLVQARAKRAMIPLGCLYIGAVFLTYFLIGIGIYAGLDFLAQIPFLLSTVFPWITALVGVLVIGAGLINVKDYFAYGLGFSFGIPDEAKGTVKRLAHGVSLASAIGLAVLVTLVEFPCSGIMYLGLITYFVQRAVPFLEVLVYLLAYNLIFVLPLLLILAGALLLGSVKPLENFRRKHRGEFRLVMGLVLIALGVLLLGESGVLPL